jgi:predicted acylesterase/phospholipase RssA
VLQDVTDVAAVSGGSILAAHLVLNWDRYNGDEESFAEASAEIVKFVQFDLRNHIVRRMPMQIPLRMLARLPAFDRRDFTPNALLERYYKKYLYGDRCLYELPEQPMLHILATSVSTGAMSAFNRQGLFIQQRANDGCGTFDHIPGQLASIPRVVGASSAFPGFFPPVEINAADLGVRDGQFSTEFFTDGGVYDNLGLRAFTWLKQYERSFDHVLVSDAGKPFQILSDASLGFVGQSVRASDILWDRVWQLEREYFGSQTGFLFLPITETVELSDDPAALHPVSQAEVQTIRTDLDRFSDLEINALAQHGYGVARKLLREHGIVDVAHLTDSRSWAPIPTDDLTTQELPAARSRQASAATQMSRQLRKSAQRRVWSTLLDWRDWTSYVYMAIASFLLFYLPLQVYQLYKKSQMQAEIIASISDGDPDIRTILELVTSDPTAVWVSDEVLQKPQPAEVDYDGVEVLTHTRIYDLRRWYPDEKLKERRGHIYIRDRITLKLNESYDRDDPFIFQVPSRARYIEFRQPNDELKGVITRVMVPVNVHSQKRTLYEFAYDLSELPPDEPVTLEIEAMAGFPNTVRAPFVTHTKTDLISVWMLFPEDRPYRSYDLVSYPADRSEAPNPMENRYQIDHPYGSFIGWSVVNPEEDRVYECRWTTE